MGVHQGAPYACSPHAVVVRAVQASELLARLSHSEAEVEALKAVNNHLMQVRK